MSSTPEYSSCRYSWCVLVGGSSVGDEDVFDDGVDEEVELGGVTTDWGMDFRANERTSAVSSRSDANRVMAKSRVCSFSRAALRCRFRKSACK